MKGQNQSLGGLQEDRFTSELDVFERLNQLEERVSQLEKENAFLAEENEHLRAKVETTLDSDGQIEMFNRATKLEAKTEELSEEIEDLKETNSKLIAENDTLRKKISDLQDANEELREKLESAESTVEDIDQHVDILERRADAIVDRLEDAEDDTDEKYKSNMNRIRSLAERVEALENLFDEDEGITEIQPDESNMAQLSKLSESIRRKVLNKDEYWATILYNNFEKWSSYDGSAYIIPSSSVRSHMTSTLGKDLYWEQTSRILETFEEMTSSEYELRTVDGSKVVVKLLD